MALMLGQKMTAVPKLSYLHVSRLNSNRENVWNFLLLKGSTFNLKDKKSDIGTFNVIKFRFTSEIVTSFAACSLNDKYQV